MLQPKITMFDLSTAQGKTAAGLFETVLDLPLVCPHSHVDPEIFINPDARFKDPAELFVTPDHYVVRMLASHGLAYEQLGVLPPSGEDDAYDPRMVWQTFCENFYLFDGTPSGLWIENALSMVFAIDEKPNSGNADLLYEKIQTAIDSDAYSPRRLYQRFNIEVLCTTDFAVDTLDAHQALRNSRWHGQLRPTFRPDGVVNIGHSGWRHQINKLSQRCNMDIHDYGAYIQALEARRTYFKSLGAVSTDHDAQTAFTCRLSLQDAESIFQSGLNQQISPDEAKLFIGHMLVEMARMSLEDGLVMQLHAGSYRNHNPDVFRTYGPDMGFDIPLKMEWTRNLKPLLDRFGTDKRLRLILFTLDESGYARELAPLAGAYPAIKLGPPWWFHDSPSGILRYFDNVIETAGMDNTVGFNDDTRSFVSIPARHDLWRRMAALWLAKLVRRGQIDLDTAQSRLYDLAYGLAKKGYRLD
jgi:glucuronate isomerase